MFRMDLAFYFTSGSISWRFPIAFQIVFILVMIICMYTFRLPESPRWLAAKGKNAESLAVLAALSNTTVDDQEVMNTFHGITDTLAAENSGSFKFSEIFTHGKSQHFRRTLLGMAEFSLITYYLTSVLTGLGLGAVMSRIISGVNGTCYFLTSLVAIAIVERAGRRPLMLWMAGFQAATMAILAGLYDLSTDEVNPNKTAQVFSVLMLFLFNTWFSVGYLGMTWLYPAEVTPLRVRAPANALSTASNWIFNFMVVMATGPMFANIGWGTYAFFAAINAVVILPSVYLFFPETKRYSLEDLDIIFAKANTEGRSPVRVSLHPEEIPPAGSRQAEEILGRAPVAPLKSKTSHVNKITRALSRTSESGKHRDQHHETV